MMKIRVPSDRSTIDEHIAHLWNITDGVIRGSITDVGYNEWDLDGKDLLKHPGFDIKTDAING